MNTLYIGLCVPKKTHSLVKYVTRKHKGNLKIAVKLRAFDCFNMKVQKSYFLFSYP